MQDIQKDNVNDEVPKDNANSEEDNYTINIINHKQEYRFHPDDEQKIVRNV